MNAKIFKADAGFTSGMYPRRYDSDATYDYVAWTDDPTAATTAAKWHVHRINSTTGDLDHPKNAAGNRSAEMEFACNDMPNLTWA